MSARVIVENGTGHAKRVGGCGTLFQIALVSRTYRPQVAWLTCLQNFTIRPGRNIYRIPITATYLQCSQSRRPPPGQKACLRRGMPPLPPGHYHAELFQSTRLFPSPPAIPVLVTPAT